MKSFLKVGIIIVFSMGVGTCGMAQTNYTGSGIAIKDDKIGTGAIAKSGQKIVINYKCHINDINGPVYDKSPDGGKEFNLGVGKFQGNWDDSIKGMQVGGKRVVTIPPDLNPGFTTPLYGAVPGARPLVVEVELVKME